MNNGILGGRRQGRSGHPSRLRPADTWALAALGVAGRPVRALLSALGIALGVATLVAVLGIAGSSRAQLIAQIDALGTNLLTVTPGQSFTNGQAVLPATAPAMVRRIGPVQSTAAIGEVNANVYRNDRIPLANTDAINVYSAQTNLLQTMQGHLARGRFLNPATARFPAVVLGASAAAALGADRAGGTIQVWLGGHWFAVVGTLEPLPLAPELDRAALIGFPVARRLLGARGSPVEIYVRASPVSMAAVAGVLAATADPAAPQNVTVTSPADALTTRADASVALQSLFLALGGIALLVGGIGIANVMVISVLERRGEIGLRRALGATRTHIAVQFVTESALLAFAGGTSGAVLGGVRHHGLRHGTALERGGPGAHPRRGHGRRRRRGWRGRRLPRAARRAAVSRRSPPHHLARRYSALAAGVACRQPQRSTVPTTPTAEEAMSDSIGGTVERGQVISLTRRSAWRREYEMRAGERDLGWLRWRPGRRSFAQAEGQGIGPIELATRRRRVVVAGAGGAETLATVDRQRGGPVIHAARGHTLRWDKTARANHWAMRDQDGTVLTVAAVQGLLRSSVQISAERTMPEPTAVLLGLIGGYLALSELQYKTDLAAAIAAAAASSG